MDAPPRNRWIGLLLSTSLVLGACGSGSTEDAAEEADDLSAATSDTTPDALALDADESAEAETTAEPVDEAVSGEASADELLSQIENMSGVEDLEGIEITPELFEFLRTDETARAVLVEQMAAQGLSGEPAECFIDNVSVELFASFGAGEVPTDEQMGELLTLLDTCDVAFGS